MAEGTSACADLEGGSRDDGMTCWNRGFVETDEAIRGLRTVALDATLDGVLASGSRDRERDLDRERDRDLARGRPR